MHKVLTPWGIFTSSEFMDYMEEHTELYDEMGQWWELHRHLFWCD